MFPPLLSPSIKNLFLRRRITTTTTTSFASCTCTSTTTSSSSSSCLSIIPNYYNNKNPVSATAPIHARHFSKYYHPETTIGAKDGLLIVAILGPPNAGKTTLFNRFMCKELNRSYRLSSDKKNGSRKKQRKSNSKGRIGSLASSVKKNNNGGIAIVTDVPGTTRDRRECYGRIGGTIFRLIDTAGVDGERIGYLTSSKNKNHCKSNHGQDQVRQHDNNDVMEEKSLNRLMIEQTLEAAKAADLILLMFDARIGVTSDLNETARWLRKVEKDTKVRRTWKDENQHVMLLANKLEGDTWQYEYGYDDIENNNHTSNNNSVMDHLTEATRVGYGEATPMSAEHGEGMADIAIVIEELSERKRQSLGYTKEDVVRLPSATKTAGNGKSKTASSDNNNGNNNNNKEKPLQLAILGRPNVGKSTLVNALLGEERVIAGSMPGLTRDAIMVEWKWNNERPVQLIDTAGIRKITQRTTEIEDMSVQDANRAMKIADVAVLVLDAKAGNLQRQEMAIADAVVKEGRALVIAANKMDLIVDSGEEDGVAYTPEEYGNAVAEEIEQRLPMLRKTPVVPMSSLTGDNVDKLMPVVFRARDRWERVISTGLLNRWLSDVVEAHPPPPMEGQRATKIKYAVQTKGRPPTFLLFSNVSELPAHYMRHLARNFQDTFAMFGMEVRFAVKKSAKDNPYKPKGSQRSGSGLGGRDARKKRLLHALKTTGAPPVGRRKKRKWKR